MKQADRLLDAVEVHVHFVGGSLQLEDRCFVPPVEQHITGGKLTPMTTIRPLRQNQKG
jgi:hypothetical protein